MGLLPVTPPSLEPVSLAEARAHCRVTPDEDDALLAGYILAARQHVEVHTRRALMQQTWDLTIDDAWPDIITVPRPPLVSVVSVSYLDTTGVLQVLPADQYLVSVGGIEGRISPAYGQSWPSVRRQLDAITVRFTCGYGTNPGDVPNPLRQAMLLLVGHWYENRETVVLGTIATELPLSVKALLFPYRVFY